jgi:hypothetical protein
MLMASQAVGVATGIQDKFSRKFVGLAAIGGGVGGAFKEIGVLSKGVSKLGNALDKVTGLGTKFSTGFVQGAASSIATQGIGVATGLQDSFSWAGVAAAGVGGGVGASLRDAWGASSLAVKNADLSAGNIAANLGVSAASSIANAATRTALSGGNFGDNVLATIPDVIGDAIGSIAGGVINGEVVQPLINGLEDPKIKVEGKALSASIDPK